MSLHSIYFSVIFVISISILLYILLFYDAALLLFVIILFTITLYGATYYITNNIYICKKMNIKVYEVLCEQSRKVERDKIFLIIIKLKIQVIEAINITTRLKKKTGESRVRLKFLN